MARCPAACSRRRPIGSRRGDAVCRLGDQGSGNGLQGMVAAVEQPAPVVFLLCNNGGSLSLRKQAASAGQRWFDGAVPFLLNPPLHTTRIAAAFGLPAERIDFTGTAGEPVPILAGRLRDWLAGALARRRPALLELLLPDDQGTWAGIWVSRGFGEVRESDRLPAPG